MGHLTNSKRAGNAKWAGAAAALALALLGGSSAQAGAPIPFLAHQAAYDLSLKTSRRSPAIEDAEGRLVYSFAGSPCEGYTTEFRQVSRLNAGEGKTVLSDLRSSSWEDGKGESFRFSVESRMNNQSTSSVDGVAERRGGKIVVKLKRPQAKTFNIGKDTVFPTEQIGRIIEAAKAGKSVLELSVYDGSDDGEKVYNTLTVIGQPIGADKTPADPGGDSDALKNMTRWPVTVSYYDRSAKSESGEQTPVYAMSFELYENGVSRALTMDYNDFVIRGALSKFDPKSSKPCK